MIDFIIIVVLGAIIGLAVGHIYRSRKKGHKCIGCSGGSCGCNCESCGGK